MIIQIVAMGHRMPAWVEHAFHEYAKRLPSKTVQLTQIPLAKRNKASHIEQLIKAEGERMLAAIPNNSLAIALEIKGKSWDTPRLAQELDNWQQDNRHISLLIGGPEGLAPACLERAQQTWSLSPLTLPHPLVRIILIEQLYRARTILTGHPYHK